jgi:hypothetical protein
MMRREANDTKSVISQRTCEIDKAISGARECQDPDEVLYRGALLCEPHATLLQLEDRAEAVLQRYS